MHRYFVTGTDTDVGKTRIAGALAIALRRAGRTPTIVKVVQTGSSPAAPGDAARAGELANVPYIEVVRFSKPADPWSAAQAEGATLEAQRLARTLDDIEGPLVVEGTGGFMVPINDREHLGDVAARAQLTAVVVVGLRLGCINHALLTVNACADLGVSVCAAVLVERWGPAPDSYRADVLRVLEGKVRCLGILPFSEREEESVAMGANLFEPLTRQSC